MFAVESSIAAGAISAFALIAVAFIGMYAEMRKNTAKAVDTQQKLQEVHVLVNGRLDEAVATIAALRGDTDRLHGLLSRALELIESQRDHMAASGTQRMSRSDEAAIDKAINAPVEKRSANTWGDNIPPLPGHEPGGEHYYEDLPSKPDPDVKG